MAAIYRECGDVARADAADARSLALAQATGMPATIAADRGVPEAASHVAVQAASQPATIGEPVQISSPNGQIPGSAMQNIESHNEAHQRIHGG